MVRKVKSYLADLVVVDKEAALDALSLEAEAAHPVGGERGERAQS